MLQQTRVAAAIPYYERFLARFPNAEALAHSSEPEVLTAWSGLGYYSRARNLRRAAELIASARTFPNTYDAIRALPGVGDYTAAAVASIAFGLPHAAIDGNVRRVAARLSGDAKVDVRRFAGSLLDRKNPGRSNQALMELGATICLPREPLCAGCPVSALCEGHKQGTQDHLPIRKVKQEPARVRLTLLLIQNGGKLLLIKSSRVRGFWDLPEPFNGARLGVSLGTFRHSIMNTRYECEVREAAATRTPTGAVWRPEDALSGIPLSTTARKALRYSGLSDPASRGEPSFRHPILAP